MEKVITVTWSTYLEIMRWDDEGGCACEVVYVIIPDSMNESDDPEADKPKGKTTTSGSSD